MVTNKILKIIPGLQSTALLAENLKTVNNFVIPNKSSKNKKRKVRVKKSMNQSKNLIRLGTTNLVGIGLINATSKQINQL